MGKVKKYPDGVQFNNYCIVNEKQNDQWVSTIRRWVIFPDGKRNLERYPTKEYREMRDKQRELEDFVIRLNNQVPAKLRTQEAVEIKHAFINTKMLDDYLAFLLVQIPTASVAKTEWYYLKNYFLNYFIGKLNLANPLEWHRHQTEWAHSLLGRDEKIWPQGEIKSSKLIKDIVIAGNRFMKWLHEKRPNEVPPLVFTPMPKAVYKELKARRITLGLAREPKYILDKEWAIIEAKLPATLKPLILLGYYYGLRRSEILGLKLEDVRQSHLSIERQMKSYSQKNGPKYGPLKGREKRSVPHWNCKAATAYHLISEAQKYLVNPINFGKHFSQFMKGIQMTYTLHDLRHTWVTKIIQIHPPETVRRAAGHKDLNTTMKYIHEGETQKGDEIFIPEAS